MSSESHKALEPCFWQDCSRPDAWWDTCTLTVWSLSLTEESMGLHIVQTCSLSSFRHSHHHIPHWTALLLHVCLRVILSRHICQKRFQETNEEGTFLFFIWKFTSYYVVFVYMCGQSLCSVGLWIKPTGILVDRFLRILRFLSVFRGGSGQICGWRNGWEVACWSWPSGMLYSISVNLTDHPGRDRNKGAERTVGT